VTGDPDMSAALRNEWKKGGSLSAVAGRSRGKLEQVLGELIEAGLVFSRGMAPHPDNLTGTVIK
jgi:hypothetical protein